MRRSWLSVSSDRCALSVAARTEALAEDAAKTEGVDLAFTARRTHILDGDATGGRHMWPAALANRSFPKSSLETKVRAKSLILPLIPNLSGFYEYDVIPSPQVLTMLHEVGVYLGLDSNYWTQLSGAADT